MLHIDRNVSLYFTVPIVMYSAAGERIGQSITSPLIDPATRKHIGQVLYDFDASSIFNVPIGDDIPLSQGGSFIFVAALDATKSTTNGTEDYLTDGSFKSAFARFLPYDELSEANAARFGRVYKSIKEGRSDVAGFYRTSELGDIEWVFVAYGPVKIRSMQSVDSSDFTRGVSLEETSVYSIALVKSDEGFRNEWSNAKILGKVVDSATIVIAVVIIFACLFIMYGSFYVTRLVALPIPYVLDLVRRIDR